LSGELRRPRLFGSSQSGPEATRKPATIELAAYETRCQRRSRLCRTKSIYSDLPRKRPKGKSQVCDVPVLATFQELDRLSGKGSARNSTIVFLQSASGSETKNSTPAKKFCNSSMQANFADGADDESTRCHRGSRSQRRRSRREKMRTVHARALAGERIGRERHVDGLAFDGASPGMKRGISDKLQSAPGVFSPIPPRVPAGAHEIAISFVRQSDSCPEKHFGGPSVKRAASIGCVGATSALVPGDLSLEVSLVCDQRRKNRIGNAVDAAGTITNVPVFAAWRWRRGLRTVRRFS